VNPHDGGSMGEDVENISRSRGRRRFANSALSDSRTLLVAVSAEQEVPGIPATRSAH
jgi:hypothetical protein